MPKIPARELQSLESFACETALAAGKILRQAYGDGIGGIGSGTRRVKHKGMIDLVTSTDLRSEHIITSLIRKKYPAHGILAEESAEQERSTTFRWIVDPLDGTTNFAHGYPSFCVSLALEYEGSTLVGVVYEPLRMELFKASVGRGAHLGKKRIRVSAVRTLKQALCATGFAYDTHISSRDNLANHRRVIKRAQGVRRGGSAALDLCYVACGRFDAFWELKLSPWDTAAGALIVEEAGGTVTGFRGKQFSNFKKEIVASNGLLHRSMLDIVR